MLQFAGRCFKLFSQAFAPSDWYELTRFLADRYPECKADGWFGREWIPVARANRPNRAMEPTPPDWIMSLSAVQSLSVQPAAPSAAWLLLVSLDLIAPRACRTPSFSRNTSAACRFSELR